jgi:hypothetical protein
MLPGLVAWAKRWCEQGVDASTGQHLFTIQTFELLPRIFKGCIDWLFSDPWLMVEGKCLPYDMYVHIRKAADEEEHRAKRGSSKNEAYFRGSNDLIAPGNAGRATQGSQVKGRVTMTRQ